LLDRAGHTQGVTLVFLEDLAPSSFKGKARDSMREQSEPGQKPILLIDPQGEVRKKLKAPNNGTLVLVYKKTGHLVWVETKAPSKVGASRIWRSLEISEPASANSDD
jgi:hypothetical protein